MCKTRAAGHACRRRKPSRDRWRWWHPAADRASRVSVGGCAEGIGESAPEPGHEWCAVPTPWLHMLAQRCGRLRVWDAAIAAFTRCRRRKPSRDCWCGWHPAADRASRVSVGGCAGGSGESGREPGPEWCAAPAPWLHAIAQRCMWCLCGMRHEVGVAECDGAGFCKGAMFEAGARRALEDLGASQSAQVQAAAVAALAALD